MRRKILADRLKCIEEAFPARPKLSLLPGEVVPPNPEHYRRSRQQFLSDSPCSEFHWLLSEFTRLSELTPTTQDFLRETNGESKHYRQVRLRAILVSLLMGVIMYGPEPVAMEAAHLVRLIRLHPNSDELPRSLLFGDLLYEYLGGNWRERIAANLPSEYGSLKARTRK